MQTISSRRLYLTIHQSNPSIRFPYRKAGTEKTTLREIIQTTHKNTVVVAPTGIAALNAGWYDSLMFQLPFGGFIPDNSSPQFSESTKFETKATLRRHFKMSGLKKSVIRNMELLIIDEVSMLRALDAMDYMMQTVRKKSILLVAFKCCILGFIAVATGNSDEEWRTLKKLLQRKILFHSHVVQQHPPLYIELSKIFRQTDDTFISVLNNLRNNQISTKTFKR
jgi:hypothetical protein